MKLKRAHASKGHRVNYGFDYDDCTNFEGYWWSSKQRKWISVEDRNINSHPSASGVDVETGDVLYSHFPYPIRTTRAFRRRLRQWSRYLPDGVEFYIWHQECYFDISAKVKKSCKPRKKQGE